MGVATTELDVDVEDPVAVIEDPVVVDEDPVGWLTTVPLRL